MSDTDKATKPGRQRHGPTSPRFRLEVPADVIESSKARDSSHCMIAEAVKRARPDATHVSVDLQTIRFTDPKKHLRYSYLTPRVAQLSLISFDQGETPQPFSFRLAGAQVTRSGASERTLATRLAKRKAAGAQKRSTKKTTERAATAAVGEAVLEVEALTAQGRKRGAKAEPDPLRKSKLVYRNGRTSSYVPERIGGRTPPLARDDDDVAVSRKRAFGLRALRG